MDIKNAATAWKFYCVVYVGIKGKVVKLYQWIKNETVWYQSLRKQMKHLVVKDRQESSPGTPLGVTRGQTTWRNDKPSPGTPYGIYAPAVILSTELLISLHMFTTILPCSTSNTANT